MLAQRGFEVTYVTSGGKVAEWSDLTAEQPRAHARLLELGVTVIVNTLVAGLKPGAAVLRCVFSGAERDIAAERDRSSTSEIHVTIEAEPAKNAPRGTSPTPPPTE